MCHLHHKLPEMTDIRKLVLLEQEPLNRYQQLRAHYKRLLHDLKRNRKTSTNTVLVGSKVTIEQQSTNR